MGNAFMKSDATRNCVRCGRQYRESDDDAGRWNVDFNAGYATALVCPRCQTNTESLGAEIDSIELEGAGTADWNTLSDENRSDIILQVIEQRARTVIADHKDKAQMAGDTEVAFNLEAWAAEAIDGAHFFDGQPETVQAEARAAAASVIRQMLNLDEIGY
ncbi:hypothetical protein [Spelaeicoccus albus]|uniref:Zn ribbon nucleic-acid-binding protein n=1 Tax=Spelaeicoccus albus TaxID=1280376 RepID=A0A7Z0D0Z8_9MICO|nr:hypothetical protein [Spelaeicoccus albus]NYI66098.1 Zn ribbon nucleic-acid-binding protein [Spelaeicoccus albus]